MNNPDTCCGLCDTALRSIYRIYFGGSGRHQSLISLCMDCYHDIDRKIESSRTETIRSVFEQAGRISKIGKGIYTDRA